jgi:hypothetical protein
MVDTVFPNHKPSHKIHPAFQSRHADTSSDGNGQKIGPSRVLQNPVHVVIAGTKTAATGSNCESFPVPAVPASAQNDRGIGSGRWEKEFARKPKIPY